MPALENHTGLLRNTIPYYNKRSIVDVSTDLQHYTVYPALRRNMKKAIDNGWTQFQMGLPVETKDTGGTTFKYNIQVNDNDTLEGVSEDDPVPTEKKDFTIQAELPYRLFRVFHYSYGKWELSADRGAERLVSTLMSRRLAAENGAARGFENWFWGLVPPSTDEKTPFPLRYFIFTEPESSVGSYSTFATHNETTLNGNLLNVNHGSYSNGPAGVSRETYRRTGNWNCQWSSFTKADFADKYIAACMETDWHSPVDYPSMVTEAPDKAFYTTRKMRRNKMKLAQEQNDQNTSDLAARVADNEFFRIPWYSVPVFNDASAFALYGGSNKDVGYGLDWSTIYWCSRSGFVMDEEVFGPTTERPLSHTHAAWLGGQLVCLDAARNFVLSL